MPLCTQIHGGRASSSERGSRNIIISETVDAAYNIHVDKPGDDFFVCRRCDAVYEYYIKFRRSTVVAVKRCRRRVIIRDMYTIIIYFMCGLDIIQPRYIVYIIYI